MDQRLAEIYHTNEEQEADTEKLAAAQLAEELEDDDSIDLDGLDEEQLNSLAEEVLGGEVEEPEAEEEEQEAAGEEEEAEEGETMKLAEADFQQADQMGRIMAHSFVQESRSIEADTLEKTAKKGGKKGKGGILDKIRGGAGKVSKGIEKAERKMEKGVGRFAAKGAKAVAGSKFGKGVAKAGKKFGKGSMKVIKTVGKHRGKAALGGLALAGGAAAMRKEASAIDTLALRRAEEILAESGVEETKVAGPTNPYDVLADVVDQRAYEILAENGYEVEETEEQE